MIRVSIRLSSPYLCLSVEVWVSEEPLFLYFPLGLRIISSWRVSWKSCFVVFSHIGLKNLILCGFAQPAGFSVQADPEDGALLVGEILKDGRYFQKDTVNKAVNLRWLL